MTNDIAINLNSIYHKLYKFYGPQGWWPLIDQKGSDPLDKECNVIHHPLNYEIPNNRDDIYQIILGTILTQNTNWDMAQRALCNLNDLNVINPEKLSNLDDDTLKKAIKCAGFLNQKAKYVQEITKFYILLDGQTPERNELIKVKGVGNETADSILLYAFKKPEFVVDTYTKRIFTHNGMLDEKDNYLTIKHFFESNLSRNLPLYNEYHALIVEHAKRYYRKKPYGMDDPIIKPKN